ncbi:MAG: two-component regulator propeller domain-containing protein [Bacteriovoracaceae bacterium]
MRAGTDVMMSRWTFVFVLGVCCCFSPIKSSAGIGDWKNYTDMKSVRSMTSDGQTLWAATAGGIFQYNPSDSSFQKFVNSDGLSTNDATAILHDGAGRIWTGQQSGNIDVYNPATHQWRYITDIALSTKVNRAINAFYQSGDNLYIATAFGVAVFSVSKFEFSDTYISFSSNISQPNVTAVCVFQNRVFLATNSGIISSIPGAVNLADPASWEVTSVSVTNANTFSEFQGTLYASTGSGLLQFDGSSWSIANGILYGTRIIAALDTALVFVEGNSLLSLNVGKRLSVLSAGIPGSVIAGTVTADRKVFLGFVSTGIGSMNEASHWQMYYPNGPNSNLFYKMVVDERGELWSASGGHSGGWGFYRFDGNRWTNYHKDNTPLLLVNDCYAVAVGPNNSKWISTWGTGVLLVNANGIVVRRFDYDFPGIIGSLPSTTSGIPSYTVPSKAAVDDSGNVWLTSMFSNDRNKVLWKMKPDSNWESFPGLPAPSEYAFMYEMVIDRNNTKWFTNSLISRKDAAIVAYHNSKRNIGGLTNNWGMLSKSDGLTDDRVQALVMDREGDIWLGTGVGITIINEPLNPAQRISKVYDFSVRDLFINCLAVDPLNNKWVGTSRGVFVLSPDGTQLLQHYSVENTKGKLVENNIFSLAIDWKKGIVYIGTEKGLSSLEIAAVTTKNTFSTIELSPNPVYLANHSSVEIRGLVDDCTVKVLALNGKMIKQFPAQGGGRAFWDCRDGEGRGVASGVYIIVAHNKAGDQVASSKVAVIRK